MRFYVEVYKKSKQRDSRARFERQVKAKRREQKHGVEKQQK
jgi:hypothetical protein